MHVLSTYGVSWTIFKAAHLASATMPWHWVFFAPPENQGKIWVPSNKKSQSPEVALVDFGPDGRPCIFIYVAYTDPLEWRCYK